MPRPLAIALAATLLLASVVLLVPVLLLRSAPAPPGGDTAVFETMPVRRMEMDTGGGRVTLEVRVAAAPVELEAGFQHVEPGVIAKNRILFVLPQEMDVRFHMRNVKAPLDIAFLDSTGLVIATDRMEPSDTRTWGPGRPFRYALEGPAGFLADAGIVAGRARMAGPPPGAP